MSREISEQVKRDALAAWRRAFGLQQIESWVTTCALRDDVDGPALLGPGGSDVGAESRDPEAVAETVRTMGRVLAGAA
jgi:hypothetical protein